MLLIILGTNFSSSENTFLFIYFAINYDICRMRRFRRNIHLLQWEENDIECLKIPTGDYYKIYNDESYAMSWSALNFPQNFNLRKICFHAFIETKLVTVSHVCLMINCGKVMCVGLFSLMSNIRIYVQQ